MASTPDVFVDPTRLRPLPRTVVPEMVKTIKPPRCPAMPYFIVVVLLNLMPCTWSFYQYHYHQNEACDKDLQGFLNLQRYIGVGYIVLVAVPMWRRINWVGSLRDTISEMPELWVYWASTSLVWTEFINLMLGSIYHASARACSDNLLYAGQVLIGWQWFSVCFLQFPFHIVLPSMMHIYAGQPASDIFPRGTEPPEPEVSLPPMPPKKKIKPKRECLKCKYKMGGDEMKMCPVCGAYVPTLAEQIEAADEDKDEKDAKEKEKYQTKSDSFLG